MYLEGHELRTEDDNDLTWTITNVFQVVMGFVLTIVLSPLWIPGLAIYYLVYPIFRAPDCRDEFVYEGPKERRGKALVQLMEMCAVTLFWPVTMPVVICHWGARKVKQFVQFVFKGKSIDSDPSGLT